MLWATAKIRLLHYGPLLMICLRAVGHTAGSGSLLWATVQILVPCYGPSIELALNRIIIGSHGYLQHMAVYPHTCGYVSTCTRLSIQVHMMHNAVYPCTCGYISTWSCIHSHMAMYPLSEFGYALRADGNVSTCTWLCIHIHVACIHVDMYHIMCTWPCIHIQNLVMRYEQ